MKNTGLVNGELQQCPSSPNCVCSLDKDEAHQIPAITFNATALSISEAQQHIKDVISGIDRLEIETSADTYIHAVAASFLFRFKDDVEFQFSEGKIDMRSASRVGHSDFGVNKKRLEQIKDLFNQKLVAK